MDRITKSLLEEFKKTQEIKGQESDVFEHFCNYVTIANQYSKTFDIDAISTGGGHDTGIDGIGIIVNGHLIDNEDEIQDLLEANGHIEASFIFVQSKTSSNFQSSDMLKFYHGVVDFFSESPSLPRNQEITKLSDLTNTILSNAAKFTRNPNVKVFYVTTGSVSDDANLKSIVETHKKTLFDLNLFEQIKVELLGAKEVGKLYRKVQNPISSSFTFSEKVTLPSIAGVKEAYYGVLPFSEFRKILIDENDNLLNVFDDNVRDYQGAKNNVNSEISNTLKAEQPSLFSVLNNGITVVADSIKTSANNFTITDYQIVNGCQTSNVLFENRDNDKIDEIYIPLRLIVTQEDDVKSSITVSTNNQTAIKKEQLSAMSDFQKNLEAYYKSRVSEKGLYYERRTKQYASDSNVIKRRIITIGNQTKSFSSMFRKDPHMVTTYFGKLAKSMIEEDSGLCDRNHQYAAYYMAGLAYYKLDTLFLNNDIDKKYKKVRFYLLMLVLMICTDQPNPPMNSQGKVEAFCNPIIDKLLDEHICLSVFKKAAEIVERSGAPIEDKQALKSNAMTKQVLSEFQETDRV